MSRKDNRKDSDPGIGKVVATGAAVLAGAAIVYGAKKLFDFWSTSQAANNQASAAAAQTTSDTSKAKSCDSDSDDDQHERRNQRYNATSYQASPSNRGQRYSLPSAYDSAPSSMGESLGARSKIYAPQQCSSGNSLSDQLNSYYTQYVEIEPTKKKTAAAVVKEVCATLGGRLHMFLPSAAQLPNGVSFQEVGSAVDDLQVINADEFDILILLKLNEENWNIEPSGDHGAMHKIIVKSGVDSKGVVYDSDGRLMWRRLVECFDDALQRALMSIVDAKFCIEKSNLESTLRLRVTYIKHSMENKLHINLIPAVEVDGKRFVPAVKSCDRPTQDSELSWRVLYSDDESQQTNCFGEDFAQHSKLLKIVKAIRLNFPQQFGQLTSYHYKTVLLRMLDDLSDKSEWSESALSERFIDFLVELGSCCKEKVLMHYFESSVNLFDDVNPEALQSLAMYINKILGRNDFESLLAERSYKKL